MKHLKLYLNGEINQEWERSKSNEISHITLIADGEIIFDLIKPKKSSSSSEVKKSG